MPARPRLAACPPALMRYRCPMEPELSVEPVVTPPGQDDRPGVTPLGPGRGGGGPGGAREGPPAGNGGGAPPRAARGVAGLIIAPAGGEHSSRRGEQDMAPAVVFVDRPPVLLGADAVMAENPAGAAAATAHLV